MKETYMIKADGTKVYTRDDNAPQMRKVIGEQRSQMSNTDMLRQKLSGKQQNPQRTAQMGRGGDTELAHVNQYEKMLLKRLGGSGTINPRTGLREFTTSFNFPMDIMPTSTSSSSSSSYTGLPEADRTALMGSITPQLQQAITNMPQNIDAYTNQALGSYQQMMQNALRNNMPKTIAGLANRGIINSTEGQNALSQTMSDAAIDASNKGYQTAMQQALLKANMPTVLGQLAELGKYASSSSSSTSTTRDPTQMYKVMAGLIGGMM